MNTRPIHSTGEQLPVIGCGTYRSFEDAMELLYEGDVDAFCIVSSDCDFTGLALRIQEKGPLVYGFGEPNTMRAFVAACDEFFYLGEVQMQA